MIEVVSCDGFIVEIKLIIMLIILEITRMVLRNINLRQFWTNNKNVIVNKAQNRVIYTWLINVASE